MTFDESRWPVVIVRLPRTGSLDDIHRWYDHVEAMLRRSERPLGLVHDLRAIELLSGTALQRRAIAERSAKLGTLGLAPKIAADARVIGSEIIANVVAVIDWLTGERPWPQQTFATMEEALVWARMRTEVTRPVFQSISRELP